MNTDVSRRAAAVLSLKPTLGEFMGRGRVVACDCVPIPNLCPPARGYRDKASLARVLRVYDAARDCSFAYRVA